MQECVNNCQHTQELCLKAVTYCLERGEEYADPECVALLMTCASICDTSAKAMLVGSEHHTKITRVCAEICDAVVEDFEEFDDRMLRRLVDVARNCSESCREMSRTRFGIGRFASARTSHGQYAY
jgi:hypothetical protein